MIIVDSALRAREEAHDPIKVGMIGAGFMARGLANQIVNSVPGMTLAAIANRTVAKARRAYVEAGLDEVVEVSSVAALNRAIETGIPAVTQDPLLLCEAGRIDALLEVTGTVEYAAQIVLKAIEHRKHVVLMNAELDGTVGPILKTYADRAGVVLSACDGDQPGVEMNLVRFVRSIGLRPLVCGNIKGLQDPYRNPTTQEGFAKRWGQTPSMVTSFADGSKISFEQAIVANGTGMCVSQRGMIGRDFAGHIDELTQTYDVAELEALGGIVDYVVGAKPSPGVYVLAAHDDAKQRHYLNLYKLGEGPLYSFYTPYHLCHFEAPLSLARAVLFHDAVLTPLAGPRVEVVATAKIGLKAGETLDGIGQYMTYGQCENADVTARERLLPMGVAEGCHLLRDIPRDQVLTYADVTLPQGRLCDWLRHEQHRRFGAGTRAAAGSVA
ncbi:MAG TPA: NAD(P)-dependent oxidoreductase [Dehalococcoidia bacterium]|nr:NAD(P)-dependent oxidoreductase [Dehalococcoidia bacterium]